MTSLREAREAGKLEEFIAEREAETGDRAAMDKAIRSMAGKSSAAPKASPRRSRDG